MYSTYYRNSFARTAQPNFHFNQAAAYVTQCTCVRVFHAMLSAHPNIFPVSGKEYAGSASTGK